MLQALERISTKFMELPFSHALVIHLLYMYFIFNLSYKQACESNKVEEDNSIDLIVPHELHIKKLSDFQIKQPFVLPFTRKWLHGVIGPQGNTWNILTFCVEVT